MTKGIKYTILGICGAAIAVCITCSFIAGSASRETLRCERLHVEILDSMKNGFVSKADIKKYLDKEYGGYIGQPLDSLDFVKMEKIIDGRSAVLKSEAFATRDGTLNITVTQRRPVVRFQKKDGGFYADAEGFIFPLQNSYASHVQIIDGNIPLAANSGYKGSIDNPQEREWFDKIMKIVRFMEGNKTWKDKIVQIHVGENGELTMIPREGKERFLFGQPVCVEKKFGRMEAYYSTIVPEKGADRYSTVDVRFEGQIVCK